MENLEIISTTTNVQAKEVINNNTVRYSYNYEEGVAPLAITFTLARGKESDASYTGNFVMQGSYYPQTEKFDINTLSYKPGDAALQEAIYNTCIGIVEGLE